jgi:hypothetical protein
VRPVFLSRPTAISSIQKEFCRALEAVLQRSGLQPKTVGVNEFGNEAPLLTVRRLMEQCSGVVVLGLTQFTVTTGVRKPCTPAEQRVRSVHFPTPWNQLEAGMAFALDLPLLIVHESSVAQEGIFDAKIGDRFVHQTDLSLEWLGSKQFLQPYEEWVVDVRSR